MKAMKLLPAVALIGMISLANAAWIDPLYHPYYQNGQVVGCAPAYFVDEGS